MADHASVGFWVRRFLSEYLIHERGVSRKYDVTVGENEMTWRRDNPEFSQWMTTRAEPGGDRMTSTGQLSEKGGPWQDDLSLIYMRADPA